MSASITAVFWLDWVSIPFDTETKTITYNRERSRGLENRRVFLIAHERTIVVG